jgi:AAHS family 4-hydroxybenzoate transporter-like MFS transporter
MSEVVTPHAGAVASGAAEPRSAVRQRWLVFGLCAATMFTEGYDAQFMGSVVPGIAAEWGVPAGALWPTLSAGLVGLMLGAFFIAPLADNFGRRRLIIYSVGIFGVLTIASVFATNITEMAILRLLTGLGLGGAMANTTALTAEFSPPHRRALYVATMFCTFSLGASFGGLVSAALMDDYGWKAIFLICGIMAVLLLPALIRYLPESLIKEDAKLTIPFGKLFTDRRARFTVLIWVVFFANLMELYIITSWLPTALRDKGLDLAWANIAVATVQLGGVGSAFFLAWLVDRYGPRFVLPFAFLTAVLSVATLGLSGSSLVLVLLASIGVGVGTVGAQNCNNGIAAKFYPTEIRATGVGWALAVGRVGSIIGPAVGGLLLATGPDAIFVFAMIPPLVAAAAYLVMGNPKELSSHEP